MGQAGRAEELVGRLRFPGWVKRGETVRRIVDLGAEAVPALQRLLAGSVPEEGVRLAALAALLGIVIEELASGPFVAEEGRFLRVRPPLEHACNFFRAHLLHQNQEVRRPAALGCGLLGDDAAVEPLVYLIQDGDEAYCELAMASLRSLTGQPYRDPEDWHAWWRSRSGGEASGSEGEA